MKFRPCIDIHNGKVKQIVGGSLRDEGDRAVTNFSSELGADWYARRYQKDRLTGGHIILLNHADSPYFEETKRQALEALNAYPKGMQIGGGITSENAADYIEAGASHVIVTSYVFSGGKFHRENLEALVREVGKDKLVLDLSCRRKDGDFYIVTDRWQKFTEVRLSKEMFTELAGYCDEFLVHGVDVEGKAAGFDRDLVRLLRDFACCPVTYAGGIGSVEALKEFEMESQGKLDFTIGSALDIFGGTIPYEAVARMNGNGNVTIL